MQDRYGNAVTTGTRAACDAYVEGCDLLFALWTGAEEAFARATREDPGFALAHLGTAQIAAMRGDVPALRAALAAAAGASDLSAREASQRAFLTLMLTGKASEALAAARTHLGQWPRDAVVMNHYGPILGLVSQSGRPGVKREQEIIMDFFAPDYGEDWWYLAHHAMALSEVGRTAEAARKAERALALRRHNTWAVHAVAHVAYETGEAEGARGLLRGWLPECAREAPAYGHVAWHLAIAELHAGDEAAAFALYARRWRRGGIWGCRGCGFTTRCSSSGAGNWPGMRMIPRSGGRCMTMRMR